MSYNVTTDGSINRTSESEELIAIIALNYHRVSVPFVVSIWIGFIIVVKSAFNRFETYSSYIPESCLLLLFGAIIGGILFATKHGNNISMQTDVFFLYLLPAIVLDAGYFNSNRTFFDNIGTITLFAVIGTTFNAFLTGPTLWAIGNAVGLNLNILHCLLFGTLLSAVDPAAVLAIFEKVHVNETLYVIVFGESLLNDAVTVVVYQILLSMISLKNVTDLDIVYGFFSFFIICICSVAIGVVFGFLAAFMTKFTKPVRIVEPLLVFTMGYLSYLQAELFQFSGILSCTFFGLTARSYIEKNISDKSKTTVKYSLKMLANVADAIIFLYIGISTINDIHDWNFVFVFATLVFCLVYRSIGVTLGWLILNRSRLYPISGVEQFIMSYGGLRGTIAFALVVLLDHKTFPEKPLFFTTCITVIYFTTVFQGITIKPLAKWLNVKNNEQDNFNVHQKTFLRVCDHILAAVEDIAGLHGHNNLRAIFDRFDHKHVMPLLVRSDTSVQSGESIWNALVATTDNAYQPTGAVQYKRQRRFNLYKQSNGTEATESAVDKEYVNILDDMFILPRNQQFQVERPFHIVAEERLVVTDHSDNTPPVRARRGTVTMWSEQTQPSIANNRRYSTMLSAHTPQDITTKDAQKTIDRENPGVTLSEDDKHIENKPGATKEHSSDVYPTTSPADHDTVYTSV